MGGWAATTAAHLQSRRTALGLPSRPSRRLRRRFKKRDCTKRSKEQEEAPRFSGLELPPATRRRLLFDASARDDPANARARFSYRKIGRSEELHEILGVRAAARKVAIDTLSARLSSSRGNTTTPCTAIGPRRPTSRAAARTNNAGLLSPSDLSISCKKISRATPRPGAREAALPQRGRQREPPISRS